MSKFNRFFNFFCNQYSIFQHFSKSYKILQNKSVQFCKLLKISEEQMDKSGTRIIEYSNLARQKTLEWDKLMAARYNFDKNQLKGLFPKLRTYLHRISLILHMMNLGLGINLSGRISDEEVTGAIVLVEYFERNARWFRTAKFRENKFCNLSDLDKKFINYIGDGPFTTEQAKKAFKVLNRPTDNLSRDLNKPEIFTKISRGKYQVNTSILS